MAIDSFVALGRVFEIDTLTMVIVVVNMGLGKQDTRTMLSQSAYTQKRPMVEVVLVLAGLMGVEKRASS